MASKKSCSYCSYAIQTYRMEGDIKKRILLHCQCGKRVDPEYTCDHFSYDIPDKEFFRRINESLTRMADYPNGCYEIHRNPVPLMTNYRKAK